jgi:hypothetical protein
MVRALDHFFSFFVIVLNLPSLDIKQPHVSRKKEKDVTRQPDTKVEPLYPGDKNGKVVAFSQGHASKCGPKGNESHSCLPFPLVSMVD